MVEEQVKQIVGQYFPVRATATNLAIWAGARTGAGNSLQS